MKNAINWFEIPVKNFERAKKFYETLTQSEMQIMEMDGFEGKMAFFPADSETGGVGGSIISAPEYVPSQNGVLIYLNGGEDLSKQLSRVEKAGGKVILPKTSIGENGFIAHFSDTEGNKIALHSMK